MISDGDIDFMAQAQDEIYTLRQRPIKVIYIDKVYDDFTGQLISEKEVEARAQAVITEVSIRGRDGSRYVENGIEYEQGDVKIDIKVEYVEGIADKLTRAIHDGKTYELLGGDRKGIGKRNRYEFIGREIA